MKAKYCLIASLAFLAIALIAAGYVTAADDPVKGGCPDAKAAPNGVQVLPKSAQDMVNFVDEAVAYAKEVGAEKAQKEFSTVGGKFHRYNNEMYIYAYDFNGVNVAHGLYPDWVGKSKIDLKDPAGLPVIEKLRDLAKSPAGGGFLEYGWENPTTHQSGLKFGYCRKVDDNWWLGSGIYLPDKSTEAMVQFVEEAVIFAKIKGDEAAKKEFSTPGGMFHRYAGQWYIYAYDYNGINVAHGLYPDWVGQDKIGYVDANGLPVIVKLRDIAKSPEGKGWLDYVWENPTTHQKANKRGYCARVNDNWWLGSGMYAD